jgi:hypothetical protein
MADIDAAMGAVESLPAMRPIALPICTRFAWMSSNARKRSVKYGEVYLHARSTQAA